MNDFATSLACLITARAPRPLCKTHRARALEMASFCHLPRRRNNIGRVRSKGSVKKTLLARAGTRTKRPSPDAKQVALGYKQN